MLDAVGARLVADLFASAAHLRPTEAQMRPLVGTPTVAALVVDLEWEPTEPTTRAWVFDGEDACQSAHAQMARSRAMVEPQRRARALHAHLAAYAPLALANGLQVVWIVARGDSDRFEAKLHNRNRTVFAQGAAQMADTLGRLFHTLSALKHGTRSFSVEPSIGTGTRTVVAANATDAAKFWMVMESLDVLRVRPVEPPSWVVERHPMAPMEADLRAFRAGLPDLRGAQNR